MLEVLTDAAETVLKRRYYLKDEDGNCIEDWPALCRRVAKHVANGNGELEEQFFWMINELYFLPNSPALMNSATEIGQLAACFANDVEDNMESIFQFMKEAALTFKSGGGVGLNWSKLRAKGSPVQTTQGVASGVVSFMNVFNEVVETVKSGGKRRGAAISILDIDHPEIYDFVDSKRSKQALNNMNISVAISDDFMEKVEQGSTEEVTLFDRIVDSAHCSAEPGILFSSAMERANPTPHLGKLDRTNPCVTGETKVAVADGRGYVCIKDLAEDGGDVKVYCLDSEGRLSVQTMFNPRKTGVDIDIYTVEIDNGHSFQVTGNHKFTLFDGSIVEAKDLVGGDSLNILSSWINERGYRDIKVSKHAKISEHRIIAKHLIGLPEGKVVHHVNHNRLDNKPSNLRVLDVKDHTDYHMVGENNPSIRFPESNIFNNPAWQEEMRSLHHIGAKRSGETKAKISAKTKEWFANPDNRKKHGEEVSEGINNSQKFKDWISKRSKEYLEECRTKTDLPIFLRGDSIFVEKECEYCGGKFEVSWSKREQGFCSQKCSCSYVTTLYTEHSQEVKDKISASSKAYASTELGRESKRRAALVSAKKSAVLCGSTAQHLGLDLSLESWDSFKDRIKESNASVKRFISSHKIVELFGGWDNFRLEILTNNHKVVSVTPAGKKDVYNGTVEYYHNFFIGGFEEGDVGSKRNVTTSINCQNCGEINLLPHESCNLGSINLSKFVNKGVIDYRLLEKVTRLAVNFLDNVVTINNFPLDKIKKVTQSTRKLGLGFAGLHDFLIKLELPYSSQEGREAAASIMRFIEERSVEESQDLASLLGVFPAYDSKYCKFKPRRNASLTCLAPTGTLSMLMNVASSCEPYFGITVVKTVLDKDRLILVNELFESVAKREGFYSEDLITKVADSGTVISHKEIPEKWQEIFRTAMDITPEDHVKMQAALQNNGVHNAISKTCNLPNTATKEDVSNMYKLAWKLGCKGITCYVDGSRAGQVLTSGSSMNKPTATVSADGPVKQDLPDTLRARRYKLKLDDGENVYIIICFSEDGKPMEVFAKFPYDGRHEYREKSAMYTVVCRLISLALRYSIPVEEVIKQLDKSSGSMMDLPAQLTKLLKTFLSETSSPYTVPCPECGEPTLVFEEGCQVCKSCGYSKCS